MTERKADTIDIGRGIQYAKVSARLAEFHADNKECSIETSCEFKEGFALFSAKVTTPRGTFTGHSLGKTSTKDKAFEKQETIAVGRALAFAGYLSTGDIASFEEMAAAGLPDPSTVTLADLNELKRSWATATKASGDKDEMAAAFSRWVSEVAGHSFDVSDFRAWMIADLDKCNVELAGR